MSEERRIARRRRLLGRKFDDPKDNCVRDLEEWLSELTDANQGGVPAGFLDVAPEEIQAGDTADGGSETEGWAAADHVHSVDTAAPSNPTGTAASEGTGTSLMRADATIQQGIVTTKGDLLGYSTVPARVAVGTDTHVLTADSSVALGLKWAVNPAVAAAHDAQILAWMGL
jgi:hypothetical protein